MAGKPLIVACAAATAIMIASSALAESRPQQSLLCNMPPISPAYVIPCAGADIHQALCERAGATADVACAVGVIQGGCAANRRVAGQRYEVTLGEGETAIKKYIVVQKARCAAPPMAGGSPTWRAPLPSGIPGLTQ